MKLALILFFLFLFVIFILKIQQKSFKIKRTDIKIPKVKQVDIQKNNNNYTALYINLDHRKDRKKHIEDELRKQEFYNFKRFNAIKETQGNLGCSKSHLECLMIAKKNKYPNVIIFEDDFEFLVNKNEFHYLLKKLQKVDYNVCLLSYNGKQIYPTEDQLLYRIKFASTTAGYIVNSKYYDKLINNYKQGINILRYSIRGACIDRYWMILQFFNVWLCYRKKVGRQRAGYSDIEKRKVDYKV
jgi:glycosyl transferase family 25